MSNTHLPDPRIIDAIMKELRRAKKKHPRWPVHITAQAGIVVEEAGELMRACLNIKYKSNATGTTRSEMIEDMRTEAIQTAVASIRFLEYLFNNQTDNNVKHQHYESKTGQGRGETELGL